MLNHEWIFPGASRGNCSALRTIQMAWLNGILLRSANSTAIGLLTMGFASD